MSPKANETPEAETSTPATLDSFRPRADMLQRAVSRRAVMAGALGTGVMALLAACGDDEEDPAPTATTAPAAAEPTATDAPAEPTESEESEDSEEEPTAASEGWTFVDDRGVELSLPAVPERIIAWSPAGAALWDFGIRPIGIYGPTELANGEPSPEIGNMDLSQLETFGDWDPDLEKMVAAQPDLFVVLTYDGVGSWPTAADVIDQMDAIAPVAMIGMSGPSIPDLIARWEEFAISLGADPAAPEQAGYREQYDTAVDDLKAALSEKPELETMFIGATTDQLWVGNPELSADLIFFRDAGMNILAPEGDGHSNALSWEQVGMYTPDLVFVDQRGEWRSILDSQPTWMAQPAEQAGQLTQWIIVYAMSYRGFAEVIEQVTDDVLGAEVLGGSGAGTGEWTFIDGRGETITLPAMPERIAAHVTAAAALWDFGIRPTAIFGQQRLANGDPDPGVGRVDLDAVESVGEDRVMVDIEALAAHQPDIIISTMNSDNAMWGMLTPEEEERIRQIAPTLGMSAFHEPIDGLIANFEELAIALGADMAETEQATAKDDWEQAVADFETALAAKPDLQVMVLAPNQENIFFANPALFPDLIFYAEHGMQFIDPEVEFDAAWGQVSWERLGMYQVDLVMVDVRRGWPNPFVESQTTWQEHPAVKAGQVTPWNPLVVLSYQGMTAIITELTAAIEAADDSIA